MKEEEEHMVTENVKGQNKKMKDRVEKKDQSNEEVRMKDGKASRMDRE